MMAKNITTLSKGRRALMYQSSGGGHRFHFDNVFEAKIIEFSPSKKHVKLRYLSNQCGWEDTKDLYVEEAL